MVTAELGRWEGEDFVVAHYPSEAESRTQSVREQRREAAKSRWNRHAARSANAEASVDAGSNAPADADCNAEERRGEERRGEERTEDKDFGEQARRQQSLLPGVSPQDTGPPVAQLPPVTSEGQAPKRSPRRTLPFTSAEVYEALRNSMGDLFTDEMLDGTKVPKGIAIGVNNAIAQAGEANYTLEHVQLAGEYTAAWMREKGATQPVTPAWVAVTDANKSGLLKAVLNALAWEAAGRPAIGRRLDSREAAQERLADNLMQQGA
jgi:hypothetical protein